jgi:hypothetical protein
VTGPPVIDLEALRSLPEAEQKEAVAQLERYRDAVKLNPLLGYQPHPKQILFHTARTKTRGFVGGNQSGKTTAGAFDMTIQTVDPELIPPWLESHRRWEREFYGRIVVVDLVQALEGVMLPKLRKVVPKAALVAPFTGSGTTRSRRATRAG